jgi:hypothetical protein
LVPNGAVSFVDGQTYWFILGSANSGTYDWSYAQTNITTGPGLLANCADSSNAGISGDHRDSEFPYFIQVHVEGAGGPVCAGDGTLIEGVGEQNDLNATLRLR